MVEEAILSKFERNCWLWSVKSKSIPRTFVGIVCAHWRNEGRYWTIFTKWIAQFRRLSSRRSVPLFHYQFQRLPQTSSATPKDKLQSVLPWKILELLSRLWISKKITAHCRGTYKQIAGAVWKNPILRKYVQQLYLEEVDRECTAMCSLKNPSCLRSPSKKDLQRFSFKKFSTELESKAPLFSAVLWTASVRKSKRDDEFWLPAVCMSAAVLLKNRSPCMNAMQLINTIILYHSGITVSNCFNHFLPDVLLAFYLSKPALTMLLVVPTKNLLWAAAKLCFQ